MTYLKTMLLSSQNRRTIRRIVCDLTLILLFSFYKFHNISTTAHGLVTAFGLRLKVLLCRVYPVGRLLTKQRLNVSSASLMKSVSNDPMQRKPPFPNLRDDYIIPRLYQIMALYVTATR